MPLDLRLYSESGAFNVVQMDQQWIDIETFTNGLEVTLLNTGNELDDLADYVGIQVLRGVQTYTFTAQANSDIVFPSAATWDELEFHFAFFPSETAALDVRTSSDGGSSFDSVPNAYRISVNGGAYSFSSAIRLGTTVNPAGEAPIQGILRLYKRITGTLTFMHAEGVAGAATGSAFDIKAFREDDANDVNAIRFLASAGTMTGRVAVMAVKYP